MGEAGGGRGIVGGFVADGGALGVLGLVVQEAVAVLFCEVEG